MFSSYAIFEFIQMAGVKKYKEIFLSSLILIMLFLGINLNFKYFQLPPSAEHHINLGVVYYNQGRLDEAIEEYRKALKISPNFDGAHNNLGIAYFKKGLAREAIREYEKAMRINPYYADGRYNLGVTYFQLGRVDQAIKEYKKALEINPYYPEAHDNLAFAYYTRGEQKKAMEQVEKAIKLGLDVSPKLLKLLGPPANGDSSHSLLLRYENKL
jgi:tetratricopeptide (TPR) repeat protein